MPLPGKKLEALIHTRLEPDDQECLEMGNRLKNGFLIFAWRSSPG